MSFKHLLLSLVLVIACAATSLAQYPLTLQAGNKTPKINSKYNRFDDQTFVQLDTMVVTGSALEGIQIDAAYYCPGDVLFCKPETVMFGVIVVQKGAIYDQPGKLAVLADGERFLATMFRGKAFEILPEWNVLGAPFGAAMSYDTFTRIAKAKKVEMRFDTTEFELEDWQRLALSDFATLMYPKARAK